MNQKNVQLKKTLGQQTEDRYQLALDLFDVRLMIEPEIVTWACRRATKEQLVKLSGNMVVERLIPVINTSVVIFANITYRSLMQETLETHRAVVNAIEHKDSVGAKCAMNMHLTYNRQVIMELLEKRDKNKSKGDSESKA